MSKRLFTEPDGDRSEKLRGNLGAIEASDISKRPCMVRCSGLADPEMSRQPFLGRCSGLMAESEVSKRAFYGRCSHGAAKQPAQDWQKYLYMVVDDWEKGYSIYRVGEDDLDATASSPLIRIVAKHPFSWSFAAHGTNILAMYPSDFSPGIPAFDTKTLAVTVYPCPQSRGNCGTKPLYVSVSGKLLAFVYPFVEVLGAEPPSTEEEEPWSWTGIEPTPPLTSTSVSSYAVHPDGHTIFMSVRGCRRNSSRNCTYTFDMESLQWTHVGDWILPFKGRAYYDSELDALVGLCLYKEGAGHICCCDVPPAAGCVTMPTWKLGKELFFDENPKRHFGATLVYMDDSNFCLVESRSPKDLDFYPRLREVKMTSFVLRYGKEGDLRASKRCTYASMSYQVAHECTDRLPNPVAFWM